MANCKDNCIHYRVCMYGDLTEYKTEQILKDDCDDYMSNDVVPKSVYEYFKKLLDDKCDRCIEEEKQRVARVAREIFKEIEQEILSAIDNNLQRMAEQEEANEIWRMCVSKKNTLCGIYDFIAILKKKYTESEDTQ